MLELSDSAIKQLKKLLSDSDAKGSCIRLFVYGCGCCGQPSYSMDTTENGKDGDRLLEKYDLKIFIDPAAFDILENISIDYLEEDLRSGFMIYGLPRSVHC